MSGQPSSSPAATNPGATRPPPWHPRLPDWPERLAAIVEERRHAPFAWGTHDCCLFMADAVVAITGRDPAAPWRGAYATEAEAEACVGPEGLEALIARVMDGFGAPECAPVLAQRGDVVLVVLGNLPTMGVVLGPTVAAPGMEGLAFLPLRRAVRAWAV